jgi:hypothetical protein
VLVNLVLLLYLLVLPERKHILWIGLVSMQPLYNFECFLNSTSRYDYSCMSRAAFTVKQWLYLRHRGDSGMKRIPKAQKSAGIA